MFTWSAEHCNNVSLIVQATRKSELLEQRELILTQQVICVKAIARQIRDLMAVTKEALPQQK